MPLTALNAKKGMIIIMNNLIIGTAGHIDHGKTTLIKALTGRETDRLKQEKERGISIELGFTYFDLPSGKRAGIIDVPGHEKFVKNMLAGVMGMDMVMLVIAADEGIMPQTKEHLNILSLLDIDLGFVVLTKADLVDDEWLEMVTEDVKESLKGTFLEGSPIIPIDSISGRGLDKTIETIEAMSERVKDRDISDTARLPVDRVFSITGFGTVVTGTLIAGKMSVGDEIQVYPGEKTGKIRSIQVHGQDSNRAFAGQRSALNISGLKKYDINRGDIIAPVNSMEETMMLDVNLKLLDDAQRVVDNRTRIRLHLGTREVLCRVVFLDREFLTPGESCYAQLRLEETVVAKRGDKFIIRFYSPMMTIGGGEVLEPNPPKRKRFDDRVIKELEIKEKGSTEHVVERIIKDKSHQFPSIKQLSVLTVMPEDKVKDMVQKLNEENRVVLFHLLNDIYAIHKDYYEKTSNDIKKELDEYHKNNPLKFGIPKEEIRSRFLGNIKPKLGEAYIDLLINEGRVKQNNDKITLNGFTVEFNQLHEEIRKRIEGIYINEKFVGSNREELIDSLDYNKNDTKQVLEALIDLEVLVVLRDDVILHKDVYSDCLMKAKEYLQENGSITLGQFRDLIDTSRKYAVALLEDFDQKKITKRVEDKRVLK